MQSHWWSFVDIDYFLTINIHAQLPNSMPVKIGLEQWFPTSVLRHTGVLQEVLLLTHIMGVPQKFK